MSKYTDLCPICQRDTRRAFSSDGYWIRECNNCLHRFVEHAPSAEHVVRCYGDSYFSGGGSGYDDYLMHSEALIRRGEFYADLLKKAGIATGKMMDVGAAAGFQLEGFHRKGWTGCGIEPNPGVAAHANTHWQLPITCSTLEDYASNETFDLISMVQVVAHFHDVQTAFSRAAELTATGGHWLIETWDYRSITARVLGKHWHEYSPPTVLQNFSRQSLARLASQHGMKRIAGRRTLKSISGQHAKSLLNHKAEQSAINQLAATAARILPDRMRILYPADDLFWMVFQKD